MAPKKTSLLSKVFYLIGKSDRQKLGGLVALILFGALLETAGVGLILPFVSLIDNPDLIQENATLASIYAAVGSPEINVFLFWLTIGLAGFFVFKNLYMSMLSYVRNRYVFYRYPQIGTRLFEAYMHTPYSVHTQRNSAKLLRNLTGDQENLANRLFGSLLVLISEGFVILSILLFLLVVTPIISISVFLFFGISAGIFFLFVRGRLSRFSENRQKNSADMILQINQGLGGLKLTRILGREQFFVRKYEENALKYFNNHTWIMFLLDLPRYYIEGMALLILLIIVAVSIITSTGDNTASIIPVLSLFAAAAFRLLPSAFRCLASMNRIRSIDPILNTIYGDLTTLEPHVQDNKSQDERFVKPTAMEEHIVLNNISYTYPEADGPALDGVSIEVPKGASIGLVGSSGAGKTTLVDVVLGLLEVESGEILVDGKNIYDDLRSWQRRLGYIPQSIYLSDDSLRNNVAFGVDEDDIKEEQVQRAIKAAQLEEFVKTLPEGLDTVVGENGVRLSGGQRQRIGIARSLYHDPEILIMDEATAALDNRTETEVMKSFSDLSGRKTLIIIAHRLSTVENCDRLYFMKNGQVVDSGTYEELRAKNAEFKEMTVTFGQKPEQNGTDAQTPVAETAAETEAEKEKETEA